ncbi:hypothetical protein ASG90_16165 [Nocardioides sp. Soil797]|nr:hypothetical protein ASG90_16165 [Nocardioides sp. Soil797]
MFVELASLLTLVDLVVVGDNLVRTERVSTEELRQVSGESELPNAARAVVAAGLVRERVDSPMETRLRLLIVLAGLPEPKVNLTLRNVEGAAIRRYDLSFPEARLILEYDGRQHVERIEQWESDLQRREAIDSDEWRIMVFVSADIYRRPGQTLQRISRVMRARRVPGLPSCLSDQWRPHFPGW